MICTAHTILFGW